MIYLSIEYLHARSNHEIILQTNPKIDFLDFIYRVTLRNDLKIFHANQRSTNLIPGNINHWSREINLCLKTVGTRKPRSQKSDRSCVDRHRSRSRAAKSLTEAAWRCRNPRTQVYSKIYATRAKDTPGNAYHTRSPIEHGIIFRLTTPICG